MTAPPKPLILIVLDGWGLAPPSPGNAIISANLPFYNSLWLNYPHTELLATGEAVGLPKNEAGNSEVGHLNLGAGYIVYQDLLRISRSIADGSFLKNEAFLKAVDHVKANNSSLHIMGLVGSAGVHSSMEHLTALLRFAKDNYLSRVYVHAFTDGRDSPPTSSQTYISDLIFKMKEIGVGSLASLIGRYYAMDRDGRWSRTQKAFDLLTLGVGKKVKSPFHAVSDYYKEGVTDEFLGPTLVPDEDNQYHWIKDNDAVIFFNFRTDRPRQLTYAFVNPEFDQFERRRHPKNLFFVSMTRYEPGLAVSAVAFEKVTVDLPLTRILSEHDLRQLHLAESEKFPHVTYFFNGQHEDAFNGEDRVEIPSPRVATYDLKPEMSTPAVTEILIERISQRLYDFILVNFANADMVAHTGDIKGTIKGLEAIDVALSQIIPAVWAVGGISIITADHGNAETMIHPDGGTDTEHNTSPVPFIFVGGVPQPRRLPVGILADVAPTILGLMALPVPSTMTGRNLLL